MMKVKLEDIFDEYGVYNFKDIVLDLDKYLGYGFYELLFKFLDLDNNVISRDSVSCYCRNNYDKLFESKGKIEINDSIIIKRVNDYDVFYKILKIYSDKGIKYLFLFQYLVDLGDDEMINEKFEELLMELDISHYKSIICGRDVLRMLYAFRNLICKYEENLSIINNMDTYNMQNFDSLSFDGDSLYPRESLINGDDDLDKTSVSVTNNRRRVRKK